MKIEDSVSGHQVRFEAIDWHLEKVEAMQRWKK